MKYNELIDVLNDDGTIGIARVIEGQGSYITVQLLQAIDRNTFAFRDDIDVIPREAIQGFYDTDDISSTGMFKIKENKFTKMDESDSETDDDYTCSEYTTADEDSVSLTDSEQSDTE
jgi:hypothetical protein